MNCYFSFVIVFYWLLVAGSRDVFGLVSVDVIALNLHFTLGLCAVSPHILCHWQFDVDKVSCTIPQCHAQHTLLPIVLSVACTMCILLPSVSILL